MTDMLCDDGQIINPVIDKILNMDGSASILLSNTDVDILRQYIKSLHDQLQSSEDIIVDWQRDYQELFNRRANRVSDLQQKVSSMMDDNEFLPREIDQVSEAIARYGCSEIADLKKKIDQLQKQSTSIVSVPIAYLYQIAGCKTTSGYEKWREEFSREAPPQWMIDEGQVTNIIVLHDIENLSLATMVDDEVPILRISNKRDWILYKHELGHISLEQVRDGNRCWSAGFDQGDDGLAFMLTLFFEDLLASQQIN